MKKTEKLIAAALTIALGVMLIVLKGDMISISMTVVGIALLVLGVMDLVNKLIPPAVIKLVAGVVIIVCGWVIVGAVLYILAAMLLIAGILLLYEKIKNRTRCENLFYTVCEYAVPALCILIGTLFLFNQGNGVAWIFIVSGLLTIAEGGLLLVDAFSGD